jgi:hypothetical protein
MMDEHDLRQMDPKRVGLQQDRIIMEFALRSLRTYLQSGDSISSLTELLNKETTDSHQKRVVIKYKIDQLRIFNNIIGEFENTHMMLLKEDSL